jgi:two-component system chemotaxis response regulator CheB
VVLSGNLNDGTAGLLSIKRWGGLAVVQSPESALYTSMPRSAIDQVEVDHIVAADGLAGLLSSLVGEPVPEREVMNTVPPEHEDGDDMAREDRRQQPGIPSTMTCPECHGTLWEVKDGSLLKYRCRVGHAYTAETLLAHQSDQLEAALWTALRALEEHGALSRRLSGRAAGRGHAHSAAAFTEQAMDAEHHASVVRNVLAAGERKAAAVSGDGGESKSA